MSMFLKNWYISVLLSSCLRKLCPAGLDGNLVCHLASASLATLCSGLGFKDWFVINIKLNICSMFPTEGLHHLQKVQKCMALKCFFLDLFGDEAWTKAHPYKYIIDRTTTLGFLPHHLQSASLSLVHCLLMQHMTLQDGGQVRPLTCIQPSFSTVCFDCGEGAVCCLKRSVTFFLMGSYMEARWLARNSLELDLASFNVCVEKLFCVRMSNTQ